MAEDEKVYTPPQNVAELGIHLDYFRRDLKNIQSSLDGLKAHFISADEFSPVQKQTEKNTIELEALGKWRENFTGKIIGFGTGISMASAGLATALAQLFGG